MFKQLETIIPGFELDPSKAGKKLLITDTTACTGEWLIYSLLEMYLRDSSSRVILVASDNSYSHLLAVMKKLGGLNV